MRVRVWLAGLAAGLMIATAARGQTPSGPFGAAPAPVAPVAAPSPAAPSTAAPQAPLAAAPTPPAVSQPPPPRAGSIEAVNRANTELVVTLVRNTLSALGHANQTGNYTVLRDLGASGFAARNSATDLAGIFAILRSAKIDLAPVVLLDPQVSRASLTDDQKLYITGALATKPLPVTFELLFTPVDGIWRIDGLSITPVQDLTAPRPAAAELLPKTPSPAAMARPEKPRSRPKPKPRVVGPDHTAPTP